MGNGNGGDRDKGSKDEWKGSGGGTGTGGTKTERAGKRTGTGETGRRGTGELERDPTFITTKKNKIKKNNLITSKIIFVLTRLFLVLRGASFIS